MTLAGFIYETEPIKSVFSGDSSLLILTRPFSWARSNSQLASCDSHGMIDRLALARGSVPQPVGPRLTEMSPALNMSTAA